MAERRLSSDKLGKKGESRFAKLCSDVERTCDGSTEDRVGTDFYVDFPQAMQRGRTIDQRASPISGHFQIKTRWADTLRMQAVERLLKPLFGALSRVDRAAK